MLNYFSFTIAQLRILTLTLRDPDVSGFTALDRMANPGVFRIHRYRVLTVFFFQPIRISVLSERRPVAINLGKSISAVFTGDSIGLSWSRGSFYLNQISVASVGRFGRNKTYFFGVFKGENDSRRNLKGFMSRKLKENAIKIENQVR